MLMVAIIAAVAMLVAFVLVKGRAASLFIELRRQYTGLVTEERRLRAEVEQASILEESAEAMHNQAEADVEKFGEELADLQKQMQTIDAELSKSRADGDDGDGDGDG